MSRSAALVSEPQCREALDAAVRAARASGVAQVEVLIGAEREALTRFANNMIHQNVEAVEHSISVRVIVDQRTARATTTSFDEDSIARATTQAIALARASAPDPDLCPLLDPAEAGTPPALNRFDEATAAATPHYRAEAVLRAIHAVKGAGHTAAGIFSNNETFEAILNSAGVEAFHRQTSAVFSITAVAEDSSGWAKASSVAWNGIDPESLARQAADKASRSRHPREILPGRYTVILSPAAVLDLAGQIFADFSATAIADDRSFLSGRLGQALFGENISIADDVTHPLQAGPAFDGEGMARSRLRLVERGVAKEVAYGRSAARREGRTPTGHGFPQPSETGEMPVNIVIAGGGTSVEDMIASTRRGIFVTRLWYIREVDPYEKIMTGMTRDGTFWVEDGEIQYGIRNLRFNQSVLEMLRNVDALSPAVRASGEESFDMVVPAMRANEFEFSEVTRY
jgi:PmbA protein